MQLLTELAGIFDQAVAEVLLQRVQLLFQLLYTGLLLLMLVLCLFTQLLQAGIQLLIPGRLFAAGRPLQTLQKAFAPLQLPGVCGCLSQPVIQRLLLFGIAVQHAVSGQQVLQQLFETAAIVAVGLLLTECGIPLLLQVLKTGVQLLAVALAGIVQ